MSLRPVPPRSLACLTRPLPKGALPVSALCTHHRPDHHFKGETCRYASELQPGDKINVLDGALVTVVDAHPAQHDEEGWVSVLLDGSLDGPTLVACDAVLPVRPADGLRPDELPEEQIEVRVRIEVAEEVRYEDDVTVTVPASATADDAALLAHLIDHWADYDDVIDSGVGTVNDQAVTGARIVKGAGA